MKINKSIIHNKKKSNRGYSLIELIVTILMMGMIMAMVVMFVSISRNSYNTVNKDIVLQTEAQMATSYITDLAIEAKKCGTSGFDRGANHYEVFWINAPDNEGVASDYYYYIILFEQTTNTLRFCKVKDDGQEMEDFSTILGSGQEDIIGNERALLAQYVMGMHVELPDINTGKYMVQIKLSFTYLNSTYTTTKNIACRNLYAGNK